MRQIAYQGKLAAACSQACNYRCGHNIAYTGELRDGRLQELAQVCAEAGPNDGMSLGESIAQRGIRDAVAQPAALPEKFAVGREPWRVYDHGVGVTAPSTQAASDDIDLKIVCWPGRDAERAELAQWLCDVLNGVPTS